LFRTLLTLRAKKVVGVFVVFRAPRFGGVMASLPLMMMAEMLLVL
jgi:hypothetical protein